ncbi:50S ribosomal protein L11 [Candidatus Woesearchaeota archaeon]|nr:50S ribosomal protein L11 [Candidatus Woesearchaeota archaeon]|tara:strand:+ start:344 stop:1093 length:750 start_codon:yes stop_codon:yes gene_type:complete
MGTKTIEQLVEGGKASAAPPLGPALGPLGVNIGEVISEINKKTESFKGMQVPIKLTVDEESKEFEISVGLPPTSALLKAEAKIEKGSGNVITDKVADLRIEQIIKVAKMKEEGLLGMDMFARVREVLGSANSAGILVEGKPAREIISKVQESPLKEKIEAEKTELTEEELKELEAERVKLQAAIEKRKQAEEATAQKIMDSMSGKSRSDIKKALEEAGVSAAKIHELLPTKGAEEGAPGKPGEAQGAPK